LPHWTISLITRPHAFLMFSGVSSASKMIRHAVFSIELTGPDEFPNSGINFESECHWYCKLRHGISIILCQNASNGRLSRSWSYPALLLEIPSLYLKKKLKFDFSLFHQYLKKLIELTLTALSNIMSRLLALRFQFFPHVIACINCFLWLISFHFGEILFKAPKNLQKRRK
jgi:hypothetical protein